MNSRSAVYLLIQRIQLLLFDLVVAIRICNFQELLYLCLRCIALPQTLLHQAPDFVNVQMSVLVQIVLLEDLIDGILQLLLCDLPLRML